MTAIILETLIPASPEICFDLARSIDAHILTTPGTKEQVIDGRTAGLMGKGEFVTWRATHLGVRQRMTVKMMSLNKPTDFIDTMIKGPFQYMWHEHTFVPLPDGNTQMRDVFIYQTPCGYLGRCVDYLFLKRYMTKLLTQRNHTLGKLAAMLQTINFPVKNY